MNFMNDHLADSSSTLQDQMTVEEGNRYLNHPVLGLELVSQLVTVGENCSAAHKKLTELVALVEEDFLPLTEDDFNTAGARAYRDLRRVCTDLEALIQFPEIERHYTVAVGGMFSSGKSRFLNSLLECDLLPTDTNPTTSIPTYLTHGEEDTITALNRFHQSIPINEQGLQAICHAFHDRFNVSFSHILRLIHVRRKKMKYPRITFLDTPGYSKSDSLEKAGNVDEHIAREHLRQADFLIWLVDIQNGTIPQDDFFFIRSLDFKRPILFVLNKADKKTDSEIEQTLLAARKDLSRAGDIKVYGVTAYSASLGREYGDQGCLKQFLHDVSEQKSGSPIYQRTMHLFTNYMAFYESEKIRLRQQRGVLNETGLAACLEPELQQRAIAMAAGAKARIDHVELAEKKMETIRRKALRLVEEIAEASGLNLADESVPAIRHLTQLVEDGEEDRFRFQGSMNGVTESSLRSLLNKASLDNLRGKVRKIDSIFCFIDVEGGIEVVTALAEVQKITGLDRIGARDLLPPGTEVSIHLREKDRCTVIYPPLAGAKE